MVNTDCVVSDKLSLNICKNMFLKYVYIKESTYLTTRMMPAKQQEAWGKGLALLRFICFNKASHHEKHLTLQEIWWHGREKSSYASLTIAIHLARG